MTADHQHGLTPAAALDLLKAGNERYVSGGRYLRDVPHDRQATVAGQYPFAIILGCIDSRAPAEVIFDCGIGDIFNARVAGNVTDGDILGSMEYSCEEAGAKVVLVMGHSSCGAVKGACDNIKLGNLTGLLAKIEPSVKAVKTTGERNSKNADFVQAVAEENVRHTVKNIPVMSPVLKHLQSEGKILIVGSMYDLASGKVTFFETPAARA